MIPFFDEILEDLESFSLDSEELMKETKNIIDWEIFPGRVEVPPCPGCCALPVPGWCCAAPGQYPGAGPSRTSTQKFPFRSKASHRKDLHLYLFIL